MECYLEKWLAKNRGKHRKEYSTGVTRFWPKNCLRILFKHSTRCPCGNAIFAWWEPLLFVKCFTLVCYLCENRIFDAFFECLLRRAGGKITAF